MLNITLSIIVIYKYNIQCQLTNFDNNWSRLYNFDLNNYFMGSPNRIYIYLVIYIKLLVFFFCKFCYVMTREWGAL